MASKFLDLRRLSFFVMALFCALSNRAGTFSSDFTDPAPPGLTLFGNALIAPTGGVNDSGVLELTTIDPPAQTGAVILDALDVDDQGVGVAVASFTANFKVLIGGPSASPAFGFSFVFGPGVTGNFGVDGAGTGLKLVFETFDRGNGRAPTIDLWFGPTLIATHKTPNLRTGNKFVACSIRVNEGGTLDLDYDGVAIYRNVFCYTPQAGNFGFGAATGGIADNHWIDDLNIITTTVSGPTMHSTLPSYTDAAPNPLVQVVLADATLQDSSVVAVNTNSIKMKFDSVAVASPVVTQDGAGLTSVQYEPPGILNSGSLHTVELSFADNAVPPVTHSLKYDFVVAQFSTLPASYAVASGVVDTSASGFKVIVNQVALIQPNTINRAERQLAGQLKDASGQTLPNIADLSGAVNGVFNVTIPINWSQDPSGAASGFFPSDDFIPGIPGTDGTDDNIAAEAITYLDLQPGVYTFGFFADDGYKLTSGANPRDAFALVLGAVDAGKGATTFTFAVAQAGIYPFRLLYYEAQGAAGIEWFSINKAGNKILINDTNTPGYIKAYREDSSTRAFVRSVSPKPGETGVAAAANVEITLEDGILQVLPSSIELLFNGLKVNPVVTKPAGSTTTSIVFDPPGKMRSESVNTVRLTFSDNPTGLNPVQHEWSFTVIKALSESASRKQQLGPDNLLVLEAEDADANVTVEVKPGVFATWTFTTNQPPTGGVFSGAGAMVVPNTGLNDNINTAVQPHLDFKVEFVKTGTHYIWVRGFGDSPPGPSANDSVNVGIDGTLPATSDRIGNGWIADNGFVWANGTFEDPPARFEVTTLGEHQINVWMREDGFVFDKILFTTNPDYKPGDPLTEIGPPETPRNAPFQQDNGSDHLIVLEAEDAHANVTVEVKPGVFATWTFTTNQPPAGGVFSGAGAMVVPNTGLNDNINTVVQPHLDFSVDFVATGTYYIWVRGWGDSPPGPSANDSVNVGLDGTLPATSDRIGNGWVAENGFVWANTAFDVATDGVPHFEVTTLGEHQINVWMREDGFVFDKILLTTNLDYKPGDPLTEVGPPESIRAQVIVVLPAKLSIQKVTASSLQISWTNSGKLQSADKVTGGTWTDAPSQANPQTAITVGTKFYRVVSQ